MKEKTFLSFLSYDRVLLKKKGRRTNQDEVESMKTVSFTFKFKGNLLNHSTDNKFSYL